MHPHDHCASCKFPHLHLDDFVCGPKLFLLPSYHHHAQLKRSYNNTIVVSSSLQLRNCQHILHVSMDPSRRPSRPYHFQVHGERTMRMVVDSEESTERERRREREHK